MKTQKIVTDDGHAITSIARKPGVQPSRGVVIMAHGITSEKTEAGLFDQVADVLVRNGFETFQFDYRGHGDSPVSSIDMTIDGEVSDLKAVIHSATTQQSVFLISSSFATVSTSLLPADMKAKLTALVLLNPVLSVERTFFEPELPWQLANFGRARIEEGIVSGQLVIDERFPVGRRFLVELKEHRHDDRLCEYSCPILIIHGDRDTFVSYEISKQLSESLEQVELYSVADADHGFRLTDEALAVVKQILAFLSRFSEDR